MKFLGSLITNFASNFLRQNGGIIIKVVHYLLESLYSRVFRFPDYESCVDHTKWIKIIRWKCSQVIFYYKKYISHSNKRELISWRSTERYLSSLSQYLSSVLINIINFGWLTYIDHFRGSVRSLFTVSHCKNSSIA